MWTLGKELGIYGNEAPKAQQAQIVDPGKSYKLTGKEKKYYAELEDLLSGSTKGIQGVVNGGNINYNQYFHDLYDPAKKEITNTYNKTLGQSRMNANTLGTNNSLGYENYRANQLDKNYADTLNNVASQSRLQAYELPNTLMQSYINSGNYAGAELTNTRNRKYTEFLPALQRAQMLTSGNISNAGFVNNMATNNYNQQMAQKAQSQNDQSQMQQAIMMAVMAASDRNVKQNIRKIGEVKNISFYEFEYKPEYKLPEGKHIGVMAQEVENIIPESVSLHPSGYKMVNYAKVNEYLRAA